MKKLTSLTPFLSALLLIPLFSPQECGVLGADAARNRICVDADKILLSEDGIIFDALSAMPRVTRALRFDDGGYYVLSSDEYWICPHCNHKNRGRRLLGARCAKCHKPERCSMPGAANPKDKKGQVKLT